MNMLEIYSKQKKSVRKCEMCGKEFDAPEGVTFCPECEKHWNEE